MNEFNDIDRIFRNNLEKVPVDNAADMWQKMEQQLDAPGNNRPFKKRYTLLLLVLLLAGGLTTFLLLNENGKENKNMAAQQTKETYPETTAQPKEQTTNNNIAAPVEQLTNAPTDQQVNQSTSQPNTFNKKGFAKITIDQSVPYADDLSGKNKNTIVKKGKSNTGIENGQVETTEEKDETVSNMPVIDVKPQAANSSIVAETNQIVKKESSPEIKTTPYPETTVAKKTETKKTNSRYKPSLSIAGGMDLFLKKGELGGYGGFELTLPLNKKVNLVTGLQLSGHKMEEGFSDAEKQRINPDRKIDAKLQSLTVLQVPLIYEQPLPKTGISFRAGLTPIYILDAGIYNLPPSGGNITQYRKFTLQDLHRLNLLFTAGLSVGFAKKFKVELKGNYGLTELVKNSYINQSHASNNFTSAQVGLIYNLRKKKN